MDSEYPPPAFHFNVKFSQASGVTDTSFQEVSGIAAELETEDVPEGGENSFVHRLPLRVKHPMLLLKRGIADSNSPLVRWCKSVLESGLLDEPIVPLNVEVSLLDETGEAMRKWSFAGVYPVNWEVESFNSTKNEVAIEKLELSYTSSIRDI